MSTKKWTEERVQSWIAEGRGRGIGANYKPWLDELSFSSRGRSRRLWSAKTQRVHHLLSDVEYHLFLALEWPTAVTDIREQYPLDRDLTLEAARQLGVRHPHYPGTKVPAVMSVDFLVTQLQNGKQTHLAFDAKRAEEAEERAAIVKMEIVRTALEMTGVPHRLVFHDDIPMQKVSNIEWIRDALVKPAEAEPRPGYFSAMAVRMAEALAQAPPDRTLAQFCSDFDESHGAQAGTGLRVARILMAERILGVNLDVPDLLSAPLSSFVLTGSRRRLRVIEGG
jgi:hypothetical protein